MKIALLCLLFLVALGLEFLVHLPFVLLLLIGIGLTQSREWIFVVTVLLGVMLDSIFFRPLGATSMYFLCVIGLLFLYTRKFETNSPQFFSISAIIFSVVYILVFSANDFFLKVLLAICSSVFMFGLLYFLQKKLSSCKTL